MFYPILQKNGKLYPITQQEFESLYDKENKKFNDNSLFSCKTACPIVPEPAKKSNTIAFLLGINFKISIINVTDFGKLKI